jgi:hypothetical protein
MPNAHPHSRINFREVKTRNDTAHSIIAGFSATMPTLAEIWEVLQDALSDVPQLSEDIERLSGGLRDARLNRANLMAAARATLAAHDEGEADPLSYLRDELDAQGFPIERRPA